MNTDGINAWLTGACAGIIMAVILLWLIQHTMITDSDLVRVLGLTALACALPGCLEVLGDRVDLFRAEVIMIAVSACTGLVYAQTVSMNAYTQNSLAEIIVTVHLASSTAVIIRQLIRRRGKAS